MIGQISKVVGDLDLNIEQLSNRAVGDYAYTLLALNNLPAGQEEKIEDTLAGIENVLNVELYENPNFD
ncbi:D-3-phosphoglycerate dehydrogenase [Fructobacillus ficulneus]|uniref:D-3-phosphoglycerate dehydrogenase n=1 Tax=Fructobacillus ficulneus TaxID=157463 RepID=A0A0K8MHU2_9LACO|nr:D-3-phosphoglycerate dehydrogenase [Fructobacillus ficulneus]